MQTIAENIYYDDSYTGVTVGAMTFPYGTLLIDSPLRSEDARTWKASLLTQSRGTHRLSVILDIHADRTLGSRAIEFPIVAHNQTAEAFQERTTVFKGYHSEMGAAWEHYPEVSGTRWGRPNITFSEHLSLHWGGPEIRFEHHPGPTPGAIWVHIPDEKILFVGDAVTPNQPPFLARADLETWHETLNLLASRQFIDYTIISGRGGSITIDTIREQRTLLKSIGGRLKTISRRKGKPDETLKIIPVLLKKISYPSKMETFYTQRLQYGLLQYYARCYG
ncbi:MAG: MBL fold metallo-hydrolase [Anaerolineales bacterium]|nr:MBL fold metallo-hydrolase [Anaerolineales bacterium]